MGSSGRNCAILDLLLYHHIRHLHGRFSDKFSSQIIFQIFQGKCKLICTMGPACWDPPMLIKLIETWQSLQPWCRAENAVPNAVLCGPPCCPAQCQGSGHEYRPPELLARRSWGEVFHCTVWQRKRLSHSVQNLVNLILTRQKRKGTCGGEI